MNELEVRVWCEDYDFGRKQRWLYTLATDDAEVFSNCHSSHLESWQSLEACLKDLSELALKLKSKSSNT